MSDVIRREDVKFEVGDNVVFRLSNGLNTDGVVESVTDDCVRFATNHTRPEFKVTETDGSNMAPFCSAVIEINGHPITD